MPSSRTIAWFSARRILPVMARRLSIPAARWANSCRPTAPPSESGSGLLWVITSSRLRRERSSARRLPCVRAPGRRRIGAFSLAREGRFMGSPGLRTSGPRPLYARTSTQLPARVAGLRSRTCRGRNACRATRQGTRRIQLEHDPERGSGAGYIGGQQPSSPPHPSRAAGRARPGWRRLNVMPRHRLPNTSSHSPWASPSTCCRRAARAASCQ
jgi:hypothetical protein